MRGRLGHAREALEEAVACCMYNKKDHLCEPVYEDDPASVSVDVCLQRSWRAR